jgi:DNA invertase Pin-like site-specific DNA recombinase
LRTSILRQLLTNTESATRQYALQQKAIALGWDTWDAERIVIIDTDEGQSRSPAADRDGFQRLVNEVGLGRVGSWWPDGVPLARNNSDRHRLLGICAKSATRIGDEDGLNDPSE